MDSIHVTVAAIIRRNEKYLLVKEYASSGKVVYNQPAGHVELKESLEDAVIREVKEETGLSFTPTALVGTYLLSPSLNGKTYLRFCFTGNVPDDQVAAPQDPDIIENCWFSKEEILQLPKEEIRSGIVYQCLQDYLKGIRSPLELLKYSNDESLLIQDCLNFLKS